MAKRMGFVRETLWMGNATFKIWLQSKIAAFLASAQIAFWTVVIFGILFVIGSAGG